MLRDCLGIILSFCNAVKGMVNESIILVALFISKNEYLTLKKPWKHLSVMHIKTSMYEVVSKLTNDTYNKYILVGSC